MRLLYLIALVTVVSLSLPAQYTCSNSTITGYYGFSYTGTEFIAGENGTWTSVPSARLGTLTLHGDGTATGPFTAVFGTQVLEGELVDATVTVNADCTGVLKYKVGSPDGSSVSAELTDAFVIHENGAHIRATTVKSVQSSHVGSGEWVRISQTTESGYACSANNLNGRYSYLNTGTMVMTSEDKSVALVPVTMLGAASVDVGGTAGGSFNWLMGPQVIPGEIDKAALTVNSDCTGTYKYTLKLPAGAPNPGEITEKLIVLGGGAEIRSMLVSASNSLGAQVGIAVWERISQMPLQ